MKTFLQNNQKAVKINLPAVRSLIAQLAKKLEAADPDSVWQDVTLILTGDDGITQTNREFFGKNRPTDVISFRYEPVPGEEDGSNGDLIVNVDCAVREGLVRDGADAELALYIAHGFDHLSGAEDDTPEKRAAMRLTETKWLKSLENEIQNLTLG